MRRLCACVRRFSHARWAWPFRLPLPFFSLEFCERLRPFRLPGLSVSRALSSLAPPFSLLPLSFLRAPPCVLPLLFRLEPFFSWLPPSSLRAPLFSWLPPFSWRAPPCVLRRPFSQERPFSSLPPFSWRAPPYVWLPLFFRLERLLPWPLLFSLRVQLSLRVRPCVLPWTLPEPFSLLRRFSVRVLFAWLPLLPEPSCVLRRFSGLQRPCVFSRLSWGAYKILRCWQCAVSGWRTEFAGRRVFHTQATSRDRRMDRLYKQSVGSPQAKSSAETG